jgi:hypothetical protein
MQTNRRIDLNDKDFGPFKQMTRVRLLALVYKENLVKKGEFILCAQLNSLSNALKLHTYTMILKEMSC